MEYLKSQNAILAVNGDQNAFLYQIDLDKSERVQGLTLLESHSLYLDEIIDLKFIN